LLEVRGCWGFICGGEDWRRVTGTNTPPLPPQPASSPAQAKGVPPQQTKGAAMAKGGAVPAADPICSNVASLVPRS
jgi:hypothetical protein